MPRAEKYSQRTWGISTGGSLLSAGDTAIVTWNAPGVHKLTLFSENKCGTADTATLVVHVKAQPHTPVFSDGGSAVCVGIANYTVEKQDDVLYHWDVISGGSVNAVANSAAVVWSRKGSHLLKVCSYNMCGRSDDAELSVSVDDIPVQPAKIKGGENVCLGSAEYSVATAEGTNYAWFVEPEAKLVASNETVSVSWDSAGTYFLAVEAFNYCGNSPSQTMAVTVKTLPGALPQIQGDDTVCLGENVFSVGNDEGADLVWSISEGNEFVSQTFNSARFSFKQIGSATIHVQAKNLCGVGPKQKRTFVAKKIPTDPFAIAGADITCAQERAYCVPKKNGISYLWSVNGGGNLYPESDSALIDWHTSGLYSISVQQYNMCGYGSVEKMKVSVKSAPASTGYVSGLSQVCVSDAQDYNVVSSGGESYRWELSTSSVAFPDNDTVTVSFLTAGIHLLSVSSYNECGNGPVQTKQVYVADKPQQPILVDGAKETCQSGIEQYSLFSFANVDNNWTLGSGGTVNVIDNNSVAVTWSGAGQHELRVVATNSCGNSSPLLIPVSVVDEIVSLGPVLGEATTCLGDYVYSIPNNKHCSFSWQVNGGGSMSAYDTSATVTWTVPGNYQVRVVYENSCGDQTSSELLVDVHDVPAQIPVIYGDESVCSGATTEFYVLEPKGTVHWSLSGGGKIADRGDSVDVVWSEIGVHTLEAYLSNECGNSAVRRKTIVAIREIPDIGREIFSDDTVCITEAFEAWVPYEEGYNYVWNITPSVEYENMHNGFATYWLTNRSYSISVYPVNSCGIGDTVMKTVFVEGDLHRPVIAVKNDTLFSPSPYGNQWYYNGQIIEDATGVYYVPKVTGDYSLTVENTCGRTLVSDGILFWVEQSAFADAIEAYPNPMVDVVTARMPSNVEVQYLYIYNSAGDLFAKYFVDGATKATVNVSSFPAGTYYFRFSSADYIGVKKR